MKCLSLNGVFGGVEGEGRTAGLAALEAGIPHLLELVDVEACAGFLNPVLRSESRSTCLFRSIHSKFQIENAFSLRNMHLLYDTHVWYICTSFVKAYDMARYLLCGSTRDGRSALDFEEGPFNAIA